MAVKGAQRKERYTLVVNPVNPNAGFKKEFAKINKLDCKTLREAKEWYDILTKIEKKHSYIYDNVKQCKVEIS
jgi:hypothetical protein